MLANFSRTCRCVVFGLMIMLILFGCFSQPETSGDDQADDMSRFQSVEDLWTSYSPSLPKVPTLSVEEVLERADQESLVFLDVRDEAERAVSYIPGAVSVGSFEAMGGSVKNATVIVYCTIGYRSAEYVAKITGDRDNIYNLRGGILAWTHARQPLENERGDTKRIHVYGRRWDLAPLDYASEW
jgi:rhodanese-related sulfurtransferase